LNKFSGKDATKIFKKNHNERILKQEGYSKLCIGTLRQADDLAAKERKVSLFRSFFGAKNVPVVIVETEIAKDGKVVETLPKIVI
jgi:hypothetical protein